MSIGTVALDRCYCNKCSEWRPATDFSLIARAQHMAEDENCLCLECVDKMYRRKLQKCEVNAYIKEDRERLLRKTRIAAYEEMVGEGRRGRVMHHSELVTRLKKLMPNFVVWPGNIAGDISLYRVYGDKADFICYVHEGWLDEFSTVEFNKDKQPIHEKRGWRTALLRVIKLGLLTEEQVQREFGRPSSPQQAKFWDMELWNIRNNTGFKKD